jgi:hypothetical protein
VEARPAALDKDDAKPDNREWLRGDFSKTSQWLKPLADSLEKYEFPRRVVRHHIINVMHAALPGMTFGGLCSLAE